MAVLGFRMNEAPRRPDLVSPITQVERGNGAKVEIAGTHFVSMNALEFAGNFQRFCPINEMCPEKSRDA
jgi:hypothetical protein